MGKPVYPFFAVLKALRNEAGLTVLKAAEGTGYWNYERWESGQTPVSARYLDAIAQAFGVTDELFLFLFAWLVDHMTPQPDETPVEVTGATIEDFFDTAPGDEVEVGEYRQFMFEVPSHASMAVLALAARYHGPGDDDRQSIRLEPTVRCYVPKSVLRGEVPVLETLYGDVAVEMAQFSAMKLLGASWQPNLEGLDTHPLHNLAPMLARPSLFEKVAEQGRVLEVEGTTGLDRFAGEASMRVDEVVDFVRMFRAQLGQLLEALNGTSSTDTELDVLMETVMSGNLDPLVSLWTKAAEQGIEVPGFDPVYMQQVTSFGQGLLARAREAISDDVVAGINEAEPALLMTMLETVRSQSTH